MNKPDEREGRLLGWAITCAAIVTLGFMWSNTKDLWQAVSMTFTWLLALLLLLVISGSIVDRT